MPELPSLLGLLLLNGFMETHIVRGYRELGCRIPHGCSSVRVIKGRPFINMTLFLSIMAQLGGDPALPGSVTMATGLGYQCIAHATRQRQHAAQSDAPEHRTCVLTGCAAPMRAARP